MKKSFKRMTALLMTAALAGSASLMAMPAAADDPPTYTITMESTSGHTYTAYQVFTGDLHETTSGDPAVKTKTLSNIKWGSGVKSTELIDALKSDSTYGSKFTAEIGTKTGDAAAEAVAGVLDGYDDDSDAMKAIVKIIEKYKSNAQSGLTGLAAGYYLIIDETTSLPTGNTTTGKKADTKSRFMLEVVSDVNVTAKDGTVESSKTVTETEDTTPTTTAGQKVADYDIGDTVPYELTFKLPSNYTDYVNYPITFTDDMCKGLTWDGNAKIYYGSSDTTGTDLSFTSVDSTDYTGGKKWTSSSIDLKTHTPVLSAGDIVRVTYNATLNSDAAVNNVGNPNKYHVTFYNNPNNSTTPASGETPTNPPPTGDTPDDTTVVFTYEVVFNKVDDQLTPQALVGADFKLEKNVNSTWTDVTALHSGVGAVNPTKTGTYNTDSTFSFKGLDAGSYKLTEIKTPDGYNTIDPIEFTVSSTKSGTAVTAISGSATGLTFSPTFNEDNAKLSANVQNNKGVTLPTTGGIGSIIFYTVGTLLIAGGTVLLITKKRMSIKEK